MSRIRIRFALLSALLGVGFFGCEKEPPKEPTQPDAVAIPAEPPMSEDDGMAGGFSPATVYFDFDSDVLSPRAQGNLESLANYLKTSGVHVQVEGHCDKRGTPQYNLALGQSRATKVQDYLQNLGVSQSKVTTISYGEEQPAEEGDNEPAYARNRRAEFTLSRR